MSDHVLFSRVGTVTVDGCLAIHCTRQADTSMPLN